MRNTSHTRLLLGLVALLALALSRPAAAADLITNGGFETGTLAGWTVVDQAGGAGSWYPQTGLTSPLNGFSVPAPPEGTFAAMTDQGGPGSHVLYQDFLVPNGVLVANLSFQRFVSNQAGAFFTPDTLDFGTAPNQQARVDIITTTADPFSVAPGDVLANVFQTQVGDPLVSGYSPVSADLTALLQTYAGQTLRLRFAEVDNQFFFNFGVDSISLTTRTEAAPVPEPGALPLLLCGGLSGALILRRRR